MERIQRTEMGGERVGIPLRGLLSWRNRPLPGVWTCGVCQAETKTSRDIQQCKECQRDRVAEWMHLEDDTIIQPGIVVTGQLQEAGGENGNASDETSFAVGIVTDVKRIPAQQVELYVFTSWTEHSEGSLDEDDPLGTTFPLAPHPPTKVVLGKAQLGGLRLVDSDDIKARTFEHFGLCGNCHSVYRIVDGDIATRTSAELQPLRSMFKEVQEELGISKSHKALLKQQYRFDEVEALTGEIKGLVHESGILRRKLSPKQCWCPFCGWQCAY